MTPVTTLSHPEVTRSRIVSMRDHYRTLNDYAPVNHTPSALHFAELCDAVQSLMPAQQNSNTELVALHSTEWHLLHHLWTKAVGAPGYDKRQWAQLEKAILELDGLREATR